MIYKQIKLLVKYALDCGLIEKGDEIFCINRLLEILGLDGFEDCEIPDGEVQLESVLGALLDFAAEKGLIENTVTCRDLFDTKIMSVFVPRPSFVAQRFYSLYEQSPQKATDYYYKLSCDSDYIRRYRVSRDLKWKSESEYGTLDITVNLSKPEKTPEATPASIADPMEESSVSERQRGISSMSAMICRQSGDFAPPPIRRMVSVIAMPVERRTSRQPRME